MLDIKQTIFALCCCDIGKFLVLRINRYKKDHKISRVDETGRVIIPI